MAIGSVTTLAAAPVFGFFWGLAVLRQKDVREGDQVSTSPLDEGPRGILYDPPVGTEILRKGSGIPSLYERGGR
jgi:hypothetical protein